MWTIEKERRINIMTGIIVIIIVLLISRLAWMQLINGPQYKKNEKDNKISQLSKGEINLEVNFQARKYAEKRGILQL